MKREDRFTIGQAASHVLIQERPRSEKSLQGLSCAVCEHVQLSSMPRTTFRAVGG